MNSLIREIERWASTAAEHELALAARLEAVAEGDVTAGMGEVPGHPACEDESWPTPVVISVLLELAAGARANASALSEVPTLATDGELTITRAVLERVRRRGSHRFRLYESFVPGSMYAYPWSPLYDEDTGFLCRGVESLLAALGEADAAYPVALVRLAAPTELIQEYPRVSRLATTEEEFLSVGRASNNETVGLLSRTGEYFRVRAEQVAHRVPLRTDRAAPEPFKHIASHGECDRPGQYEAARVTKDDVLTYLRGCPVLLAARTQNPDRHDPDAAPITVAYSTDGAWIWDAHVTAYVERYDLELPPAFLHHIALLDRVVPVVQPARLDEARAALTSRGAAREEEAAPGEASQP